MRKFLLPLAAPAAILALAAPAAGIAQDASAAGAQQPTPADPADVQRAAKILAMFNNMLSNENVGQPVKTRLLGCLYNFPLSRISRTTGERIAADAALSDDDNRQVLTTAASVCGVTFRDGDAPAGR